MKSHPDLPDLPSKFETPLLLLLAVLVIFIYADTLTSPFIFDDKNNIESNPHIRISQISPLNMRPGSCCF